LAGNEGIAEVRVPQPQGERGSLKWIQAVVNNCPQILDREIKANCDISEDEEITWLSPLREDDYAEYGDDSFLNRLGVKLDDRPLREFWPPRGPQWDALGKSGSGHLFLVEAKAHIDEVLSPGTQASRHSESLIYSSLNEVQQFLGVKCAVDWGQVFYQYTNRLAHLYLLRSVNHLPAFLVFLYFLSDAEMDAPKTTDEWRAALRVVKRVLGLKGKHRLSEFVAEIFIDVKQINSSIA